MDFAWLWSFIGAGAGAYFGGYLKTKGENLATHEDIELLKERVVAVTTTTEQIKTEISDAAWNRQKRWELKHEVLFEAIERMAEVDEALVGLRATLQVEHKPGDVLWKEHVLPVYERWNRTSADFDKATELVVVVCGTEAYNRLRDFKSLANRISIGIMDDHKDAKAYEQSELDLKLRAARVAIRKELGFDAAP